MRGSYADRDAEVESTHEYGWIHSLGDIVSALAAAGLGIDFLHEQASCRHENFPLMTETEDGWVLDDGRLPVTFSLRATKQ